MEDAALARVGRYVVNRRVALGYQHRIDLANDLPITDRTLADIENGVREASAGTYAVLENRLGWRPGSIEAVRAGNEPIDASPVTVGQQQQQQPHQVLTTSPDLKSVSTEELLIELRHRIVFDRAEWNDDGPRGLRPHGGG